MSTPSPSATQRRRAAALQATIDGAIARLAEELAAGHTAGYRELLAFYGRFWSYSVNNTLLIRAQCPQATRVAGYRLWQQLGYQVAKGAAAIWIRAPLLAKVPDPQTGEEVEILVGYRPVSVFDASQLANLDERPLPTHVAPLPDDADGLYRRLVAQANAAGITVVERALRPGVLGASIGGTTVQVARGLDSRNRVLVLLHELAHALAHHGAGRDDLPTAQVEFEAESTAYVVAAALGVEHPSARDYLLSHAATPELLTASLGTVQRLVRRVLGILEAAEPADEERRPG